MATGIMQVSPARFTGPLAKTLPVYIPSLPVPGASAVWDARTVREPAGAAVSAWPSVGGAGPVLTPGGSRLSDPGAPSLVSDADGSPAIRFGGKSDRSVLGATFNRPAGNTVVAVVKIRAHVPGQLSAVVGSGASASVLGQVMAVAAEGTPRTYAGTALPLFGSAVILGRYHVLVSVFDGANSVINMDGTEATGPAGDLTATVLSVGGYQAGQFSEMDLKTLAYYPFPMTAAQRAKTVAGLIAAYGI